MVSGRCVADSSLDRILGALMRSLLMGTVLPVTCVATVYNTVIINLGFPLKQLYIFHICNKPIECWILFTFFLF